MEVNLARQIAVAARREKADLVIKNGRIIDVFNGDVYEGDIAIADGYIAGIGKFDGKETLDAKGRYISPGLIDGHVHIESSMVTPQEFAKVLLLHGVTTAIADPHEIANVSGSDGIEFILKNAEDLPVDLMIMLPSCVPATEFEQSGAKLDAAALQPFYQHPRVLGLAEVMNFPAVKNGEEDMLAKIAHASQAGKKIDGHAAGLSAEDLNVYLAAGITTDHECTSIKEARERLRKGMYVMLREGTVAKDLKNLIGGVNEHNARRCLFATDDKHLDDLIEEGSINYNCKVAIQSGINPVTAIQMATINAAECFGLHKKGAVAPGYQADLLLIDNLKEMKIHTVIKSGKKVLERGRPTVLLGHNPEPAPKSLTSTVSFYSLCKDDLQIQLQGPYANIIEVIPNSLITRHIIEEVDREPENIFRSSASRDQLKLMLVERHKLTGKIGLGIVKGMKLQAGAIASTVSHDSHNLIVCGENDEDMLLAANELRMRQGGLIAVKDGNILASLDLPIGGLMSNRPFYEVYSKLKALDLALEELGASSSFNPLLTLSFLALPVIPELKLTLQGLFHIGKSAHLQTPVPDKVQNLRKLS
jgi:adenine deaminase